MKFLTENKLKRILPLFKDPELDVSYITFQTIKKIDIERKVLTLNLQFSFPIGDENHLKQKLVDYIQQEMSGKFEQINIEVIQKIESFKLSSHRKRVNNIKNILAISSGKGGVGKSTTTVNLALALTHLGAKVGILDADIYGPNQPEMLGINEEPEVVNEKNFIPLQNHGVYIMSIGFLVKKEQAMIWRGPMATGALLQLLNDTIWPELDYLLIDMPPGTGDIHLTLAQKTPLTAAAVVTTPQDIALLDARKGIEMFKKVNVPTLGIIENMSTHVCSKCGHEEAIFGEKGASQLAEDTGQSVLGQLPLDINIRSAVDVGAPSFLQDPSSHTSKIYQSIAQKLAAKMSLLGKDYSAKLPGVIVE